MTGMEEKILELARQLSGATEQRRPLLEALCAAAAQRWRERLREGVELDACREAFSCAAAFSAAAALQEGGSGEMAAFTAGDLSIRGRTAAESAALAAALRKTAEELMAPYALPEDFAFQGVRG